MHSMKENHERKRRERLNEELLFSTTSYEQQSETRHDSYSVRKRKNEELGDSDGPSTSGRSKQEQILLPGFGKFDTTVNPSSPSTSGRSKQEQILLPGFGNVDDAETSRGFHFQQQIPESRDVGVTNDSVRLLETSSANKQSRSRKNKSKLEEENQGWNNKMLKLFAPKSSPTARKDKLKLEEENQSWNNKMRKLFALKSAPTALNDRVHGIKLKSAPTALNDRVHGIKLKSAPTALKERVHGIKLKSAPTALKERVHGIKLKSAPTALKERVHGIKLKFNRYTRHVARSKINGKNVTGGGKSALLAKEDLTNKAMRLMSTDNNDSTLKRLDSVRTKMVHQWTLEVTVDGVTYKGAALKRREARRRAA